MWFQKPRWRQRIERILVMVDHTLQELKDQGTANAAKLAKVKTDLEAILAKLEAFPRPGLTAEQQNTLNEVFEIGQGASATLDATDAEEVAALGSDTVTGGAGNDTTGGGAPGNDTTTGGAPVAGTST